MSDARKPRRVRLFAPFVALGVAIAAYSIYWNWMAAALVDGVEEWIEDQRRLGYTMVHQGLDMRGYPYRFSLHVAQPEIEAPDRLWAWTAETLRLSAMPYNLYHVIAQSPGEHRVRFEGQDYTAVSDDAVGSLSWTSEALKRLSIVIPTADIQRDGAPFSRVENAALHISPMPEAPTDIRILAQADRVDLPAAPRDAPWLGETLGPVRAPIAIENGFAALDQPDPLRALFTLKVRFVTPLTTLDWGPLMLRAKTEIGVDRAARPEGLVQVRLEEIDALEAALRDAGALNTELRLGLGALKGMTAGENFAPILLEGGLVKIGPLPIAQLAPLY